MIKRFGALSFISLLFFSSITVAEEQPVGEALAQQCLACHGGNAQMDNRLAPPFIAVKQHYLGVHSERDAFVEAVVEWVKEPDESKTLMKGAIKNFGIMAPIALEDEQLTAIAEFLFDADMEKPDWFDDHYQQEHGSQQGNGMAEGEGKGMHKGMHNKGMHKGEDMPEEAEQQEEK